MKFVALAPFETVVLLLLLETSWWGSVFNGHFVMDLFHHFGRWTRNDYRYSDTIVFYNYGILPGLTLILRICIPIATFIALINNKINFLKTWYWTSIALDALLVAFYITTPFLLGMSMLTFYFIPAAYAGFFLILRYIFYKTCKSSIAELEKQEEPLLPKFEYLVLQEYFATQVCRRSIMEVILTFHVVWGITLMVTSLAEAVYRGVIAAPASSFLPAWIHYEGLIDVVLDWSLLLGVMILSGLQLLAVRKGWLGWIRIFWILLILTGIFYQVFVATVLGIRLDLVYSRDFDHFPEYARYITLGIFIIKAGLAVGLNSILAKTTAQYFSNYASSIRELKEEAGIMEPLLIDSDKLKK